MVATLNQSAGASLRLSQDTQTYTRSVSEEVARAMAEGGKSRLGVDLCISTTGIAGPTGGTEDNPVGMVWVAIATPETTITRKFHFSQHRERNIHMTVLCALNLLRNSLSA